jgi:hypothetical protein
MWPNGHVFCTLTVKVDSLLCVHCAVVVLRYNTTARWTRKRLSTFTVSNVYHTEATQMLHWREVSWIKRLLDIGYLLNYVHIVFFFISINIQCFSRSLFKKWYSMVLYFVEKPTSLLFRVKCCEEIFSRARTVYFDLNYEPNINITAKYATYTLFQQRVKLYLF